MERQKRDENHSPPKNKNEENSTQLQNPTKQR
jgi:hypothetical protein